MYQNELVHLNYDNINNSKNIALYIWVIRILLIEVNSFAYDIQRLLENLSSISIISIFWVRIIKYTNIKSSKLIILNIENVLRFKI